MQFPIGFRRRFLKSFRLYSIVAVGLLAAYFVYVTISRGLPYAVSIENLRWFGLSFLFYFSIAALIAALATLSDSD